MDKNSIDLYSERDKELMRIAEEARMPGKNKIEEIKKFASLAGYKRIGIATCIAFQKEAEKLKEMLSDEFDVYITNCKLDKITSTEFFGVESKGLICNPVGQANELEQNKTELNISFGLCMGHDLLFNQKSVAPVTTLIVKDREFKHNPMAIFKDL